MVAQEETAINPKHYQQGKIQVWDFIIDQKLDFLEGNVIKYVCRWKNKDGLKDLLKAKEYLEKIILEKIICVTMGESPIEKEDPLSIPFVPVAPMDPVIKVGDTVEMTKLDGNGSDGYSIGDHAIVSKIGSTHIKLVPLPGVLRIHCADSWWHDASSWKKVKDGH